MQVTRGRVLSAVCSAALLALTGSACATNATTLEQTRSSPTASGTPVSAGAATRPSARTPGHGDRAFLLHEVRTQFPLELTWSDSGAVRDGGSSEIGGQRLDDVLGGIGFPPIDAGDHVYRARITTPEQGRNLQPDLTKPAEIDPTYDDDEVWVIRRHHIPGLIGSLGTARYPETPAPGFIDLAVFIRPDGTWFASQLDEEFPGE